MKRKVEGELVSKVKRDLLRDLKKIRVGDFDKARKKEGLSEQDIMSHFFHEKKVGREKKIYFSPELIFIFYDFFSNAIKEEFLSWLRNVQLISHWEFSEDGGDLVRWIDRYFKYWRKGATNRVNHQLYGKVNFAKEGNVFQKEGIFAISNYSFHFDDYISGKITPENLGILRIIESFPIMMTFAIAEELFYSCDLENFKETPALFDSRKDRYSPKEHHEIEKRDSLMECLWESFVGRMNRDVKRNKKIVYKFPEDRENFVRPLINRVMNNMLKAHQDPGVEKRKSYYEKRLIMYEFFCRGGVKLCLAKKDIPKFKKLYASINILKEANFNINNFDRVEGEARESADWIYRNILSKIFDPVDKFLLLKVIGEEMEANKIIEGLALYDRLKISVSNGHEEEVFLNENVVSFNSFCQEVVKQIEKNAGVSVPIFLVGDTLKKIRVNVASLLYEDGRYRLDCGVYANILAFCAVDLILRRYQVSLQQSINDDTTTLEKVKGIKELQKIAGKKLNKHRKNNEKINEFVVPVNGAYLELVWKISESLQEFFVYLPESDIKKAS